MTQKIEADISELRQITSWLAAVDLEFIEISRPGTTIRLTMEREPSGAPGAVEEGPAAGAEAIRLDSVANKAPEKVSDKVPDKVPEAARKQAATVAANSVGVFLAAHPMRGTPLVCVGGHVKPGDIIGLLQIAQLCVPVVAPIDGTVTQVLTPHGARVGYGTALFELAPTA